MSIILPTFFVIILVFSSTSSGISSIISFQNDIGGVDQNSIPILSVFASPDEESDENNDEAGEDAQGLPDEESDENNDEAGEDAQGLPDEESDENNDEAGEDAQGLQDMSENITTVNPTLTAIPELPQNQECPAGSPPGCYVMEGGLSRQCPSDTTTVKNTPGGPTGTMCAPIPPEQCPAGSPPGCYVMEGGLSRQCPSDTTTVKNTPGGPTGTMCAPIPLQNLANPDDVFEVNEQLSDNSILTTNIPTRNPVVKEPVPNNSIVNPNGFDTDSTAIKSSPASCKAQGTLFDPTLNSCKNPQSIQDCAKIMQRYDPNQGRCI
ncbi:hypothetical protein [Candidatus Nitrosocosmicus hydrocola]|uniref:hypothetical protein n=1 Tax=Candidatus Nitrosocosmicus hydrocola TaxID=1826872 RepID=UPI0011E5E4C4|nr:hypothetical protein [Candidatus Nitrosocosmicus hydrocola]